MGDNRQEPPASDVSASSDVRVDAEEKRRRIQQLSAEIQSLITDAVRIRQAIGEYEDSVFGINSDDIQSVIDVGYVKKQTSDPNNRKATIIYCIQKLNENPNSWAVIHSPSGSIAVLNGRLVMHLSLFDAIDQLVATRRTASTGRRVSNHNARRP